MSLTGERIDRVVATGLAPRLKAENYRRTGRTFYRAARDHTCVVNVQGNKWNEGDEGCFAINLGVYFPVVAELGGGPVRRGAFPKENECSIRACLAPRADDRGDYWWPVGASHDSGRVAEAVGAAWNDVGRPWFERAATLRGAYHISCEQLLQFPAAIFALALGEREKAADHLRVAIERLPRGKARFEEWGTRHGLLQLPP